MRRPGSNLIRLALNPNGKWRLAWMNRFARRVFRRMKVDADRPVQDARFIGPYTSLRREGGEDGQCGRVLRELGIGSGRSSRSRPGPGRRRTES